MNLPPTDDTPATAHVTRRGVLATGVALAAAAWGAPRAGLAADAQTAAGAAKIKQSIVQWCFAQHWPLEKTCQIAVELGCQSVELVPPTDWPLLKKHGLTCALAPSHGFVQGMNNPKFQPKCLADLRQSIDDCAAAGFPATITFTGFAQDVDSPAAERSADIDPEEGIRNCVKGYKEIVGYAEQKQVNIVLEMLNSRVAENMKGHPGYQGDHLDYCMRIINQVGSQRLGLLFDIYHVQIMDGDIIHRLKELAPHIMHVHTAGNPGRGELDDHQEINYPPIMRALLEVGYAGYVGQEFIPTRDPLEGLRQAVQLCNV